MTVTEALRDATEELALHGVEAAPIDAEWIVRSALSLSRAQLYAEGRRALSPQEQDTLRALVARRAAREPLAYVLGEWGFRRLTLRVDERALVPRPETEVVVERCLALLTQLDAPKVLDVGTGCGAIALAIADEHPGAHVVALDRSAGALALARENAAASGLAKRVAFAHADVADGLPGGPYDLVVSNPPYVLGDELAGLEPEVAQWEPREALVERGQTEQVARAARDVLRSGGRLVLEAHAHGAERIADLLRELGYDGVVVAHDLARRDRVVEGRWT